MARRRTARALALAALMFSATAALATASEPQQPLLRPVAQADDPLPNARLPREQRTTSRAQGKVNKAYDRASEAVAMADAKLIATKIKSSADVQSTVAQSRAEIASAAMGAATNVKLIPLVLVPGKLGQNARAEVQGAATRLVASAVGAHEEKLEALAEAAEAVGKAADKKAYAVAKADAALDKAVARTQKKSGRKIVPGTGVAGPVIVPAVAPIVTPKPAVTGGLFGLPKIGFPSVAAAVPGFGLGGAFGGGNKNNNVFGFGRRRLAQAQDYSQQPDGLNGAGALAMFGQAAMAFGAQLQKFAQAAQQPQQQQQLDGSGAFLRPEAGFAQQQQQQQQLPYNPNAFKPNPMASVIAGPFATVPAAASGGGALSPQTQAIIGAVSGAAGLALNAAAPLVREVAAAVPVMVPTVDGGCVAGKKLRVEGQGTFCVLGSWEPAAQALMNGAGLATAAAGPAVAGVANLITATRANGNGRGGPRDQAPRYLD